MQMICIAKNFFSTRWDEFQQIKSGKSNQIKTMRYTTSINNNSTKTKSSKLHIFDQTTRLLKHETVSFDKDLCLFCHVDLSD